MGSQPINQKLALIIRQEPLHVTSTTAANSSRLDRRSVVSLAHMMISEARWAQDGH
jgi:hypothetical protein